MKEQIYNFSAGPAVIPKEVLQKTQAACLNWKNGLSIMEVSHRSDDFIELTERVVQQFRQIMAVPENYTIILLQGGATAQFSAVPLNLLGNNRRADYFQTGHWSKLAVKEARQYAEVNLVVNTESSGFTLIPPENDWVLDSEASYCHFTPNETIHGVEFQANPTPKNGVLVADMSSCILSREICVSDYALIYAGAQKNIGPAGLTLVVVREDLLDRADIKTPSVLNYRKQAKAGSMYNTPPTLTWYVIHEVLNWVEAEGGVSEMGRRNAIKSERLYRVIDASGFYQNRVDKQVRSKMNVPFSLVDSALEPVFLESAEKNGLMNLQGHRSLGGMRASLYNAMPESGVSRLIEFMEDFERDYG